MFNATTILGYLGEHNGKKMRNHWWRWASKFW